MWATSDRTASYSNYPRLPSEVDPKDALINYLQHLSMMRKPIVKLVLSKQVKRSSKNKLCEVGSISLYERGLISQMYTTFECELSTSIEDVL